MAKASPPPSNMDFYVVDSLYCHLYDSAQMEVPNIRQSNLDFTEDGEVLESISQNYLPDLAEWQNFERQTYVYDQNLTIEQERQVWNLTTLDWQNDTRWENQWNADGFAEHLVTKKWNILQNDWRNFEQLFFNYDTDGNIESFEVETWDTLAGVWNRVFRILYAVNAEGQVVSELFQLWVDNDYKSLNRKFRFFDDLNTHLLNEEVTEIWDEGLQDWVNSNRQLYGYDSNDNRTEQTNQIWIVQDSAWENQARILQNFNADDEVTLRTELTWGNDQWVNFFQTNNVYDTVANLVRFEVSEWQVNEWIPASSCDFYWRFSHVVGTQEVLQLDCHIPNPYSLGTLFRCPDLPQGEKLQLEVFDLSGKLVYAKSFEGGNFVNIAKPLRTGLYVLVIRGESGILHSQKIVVD